MSNSIRNRLKIIWLLVVLLIILVVCGGNKIKYRFAEVEAQEMTLIKQLEERAEEIIKIQDEKRRFYRMAELYRRNEVCFTAFIIQREKEKIEAERLAELERIAAWEAEQQRLAEIEAEQRRLAEIEAERQRTAAQIWSGTAGDYQQYAYSLFGNYGWSDYDFSCLIWLWDRESEWNPYAHNSSSGAHGIPQALPASRMATHGDDYWDNPYTQIRWGLDYIYGRYGSPANAWAHSQSHGWY